MATLDAPRVDPFIILRDKLQFRESALPRILTGTALTTAGGYYTGYVILSKAASDPYIATENLHRLSRVRSLYTQRAFQGSLCFFSCIELVHQYCKSQDLYRNYFTDGAVSALMTYPVIRETLRRTWSAFRPPYLQQIKIGQPVGSQMMQVRFFAKRYTLVLLSLAMSLDLAVLMARRLFLVRIAKEVRDNKDGVEVREKLKQQYELDEEDWEFIDRVSQHRQFSIMKYQHGSAQSESYIGDFTPILIMHEDKKEEVEEDYKAVMQRFSGAFKKLRPQVKPK